MAEKYCKDCVHYGEYRDCNRRKDAIDLVTGEIVILRAETERLGTHYQGSMVNEYKPCGKEAIHFELRAE